MHLEVGCPPLYERLIWNYKNADIPSINRAIDIFDWSSSFEGNAISQTDYEQLQSIINSLIEIIRSCKEKFYCKLFAKLADSSTPSQTYWSILKTTNRFAVINDLNIIDRSFSAFDGNKFVDLILYASDKFDDKKSDNILIH